MNKLVENLWLFFLFLVRRVFDNNFVLSCLVLQLGNISESKKSDHEEDSKQRLVGDNARIPKFPESP